MRWQNLSVENEESRQLAGYKEPARVRTFDAPEALGSINGRTPDFIIADLRLRGESTGIDAIRELRAQLGNSIPAVLISGDTATEQLRKVSAAGLTMMHKPLKAVRLRAMLNHEFAKRIA